MYTDTYSLNVIVNDKNIENPLNASIHFTLLFLGGGVTYS